MSEFKAIKIDAKNDPNLTRTIVKTAKGLRDTYRGLEALAFASASYIGRVAEAAAKNAGREFGEAADAIQDELEDVPNFINEIFPEDVEEEEEEEEQYVEISKDAWNKFYEWDYEYPEDVEEKEEEESFTVKRKRWKQFQEHILSEAMDGKNPFPSDEDFEVEEEHQLDEF